MGKLKFKINFRFTSEILDIRFQLSNKKDTELKHYNEPVDPYNQPGEDDDPDWPNSDPGDYDDDPDGLNWPPLNYN